MNHLPSSRSITPWAGLLALLVLTLGPTAALAGRHSAVSSSITVDTRAPDAPVFAVQPTSQTVLVNSNASFTVLAVGVSPFHYQWFKNEIALANDGRVQGANTPNLTLSNVNATDAGYYTVMVTNQYGAAISVSARLSVTVGAHPALAGFWPPLAGGNVFAMVMEGNLGYFAAGDAGLVVADMSNPAAPVWVSQYDTSGSARDVFVAGTYAYVADGPGGLVILDVSNPANPLLTERHATGGTAFAVRVVGSLAMVAAGDAGLVIVNVANPANPSRLGAFDTAGDALNVFVKSNHAFIADGTNGLVILDLSNPASPAPVGGYPADGGSVYDVALIQDRAFLAAGTNGVVVLDVRNPAAPARVGGFAAGGEALRLQVLGSRVYVANGSGGLAMLDFENPSAPVWIGEYLTGGEVRFVLITRNQALLADGEYGFGVLNLDAPTGDLPAVLQQPAGRSVNRGQAAGFRVTTRGTGALDFQWYRNGLALTDDTRVSGATTSELIILGAQPGDAGQYVVVITNLAGATTSEAALLEVIWPPAITEQPQSLLLDVGSEALFNVTAVGDPPLVFQWRLNGVNLPGATEASLRIPSVESRHTGRYSVVVGNPYGSVTSSVARLSLLLAPWIVQQPTNQTAPAGATVTLEVVADGTDPLFYQWRRDGVDLTNNNRFTGTTNALLMLSNLQTNDAGRYSVVVANALGIVTNEPFALTVYSQPGSAAGLVRDGLTRAPLAGVSIRVTDIDGQTVANLVSDTQGAFHLTTEVASYRLDFSHTGYVSTFAWVTLEAGRDRQIETILLAVNRAGTGRASGIVVNALTGLPLEGVVLKFRAGIGVVSGPELATATTDSFGKYNVELPGGTYTAEVAADGFIPARATVVVVGGQTINNQGAAITPLLNDEALRIVMTWGYQPFDLDSHLTGPTSTEDRFHIYFFNPGATNEPPYANLDVDDIFSYGPETVTVTQFEPGTYVYSVHDYSNNLSPTNTALSSISDARVRVFQGSFEVASFNVPAGNVGTLWTVFQFDGQTKQVVPINQFSTIDLLDDSLDLHWFCWRTANLSTSQGQASDILTSTG